MGSGSVNVASAGAKVFPPAQEFGKRSDVFQILMPTAPTRIKLLPLLLQSFLFTGRDPYEPSTQRFDVAVVILLLNPKLSAVGGLIRVWQLLNHLRTE